MTVLGKRKASSKASAIKATKPVASAQELEDAQAIFRRHFEAQFAPLPEKQEKPSAEESEEDEEDVSGDDDEWDGVSEEEDEDEDDSDGENDAKDIEIAPQTKTASRVKPRKPDVVEVVDHSSKISTDTSKMTKQELKAYMSSKPPGHSDDTASPANTNTTSSKKTDLPEDAPTLLAQDLELRRLIQESHLLRPNTASSAKAAPKTFDSGRNRLKALDLRFQALGSKDSIFKDRDYKTMLNARAYNTNKTAKEEKRRREARENGIILEREKAADGAKGKKRKNGDRDMGVDRPGVGRMKGAQLTISEKDVRSIEGSRDAFGRGGKRRR